MLKFIFNKGLSALNFSLLFGCFKSKIIGKKMDIVVLYCNIDDFLISLGHNQQTKIESTGKSNKGRRPQMSLSEIMTLIILYHNSNFKNFKAFYSFATVHLREYFPKFISYNRFIEWMSFSLIPLASFLNSRKARSNGIQFIDSTPIKVCHNKRINRNKVFDGFASRGKSSMGWFYGFKLHLVVNEVGELISFKVTTGSCDDRKFVAELCKNIKGKLFGDKGYISKKLSSTLKKMGIDIITNVRSNMKNKLVNLEDRLLLRKRFIIETINDQLKNLCDIEHSRHRSPLNFMANLISGLICYSYREKKPSIRGFSTLPV